MAYPLIPLSQTKTSSYAKIAAMPAPTASASNNLMRKDLQQNIPPASEISSAKEKSTSPSPAVVLMQDGQITKPVNSVVVSLQKLCLGSVQPGCLHAEPNGESVDSFEEDQSQMSGSSVNKPQSFDTKSLASVTTFAMDDKESIRPDDSASVRAADDETPHPALSRNSSFQHDSEQPAPRSARVFPANVTIPGRRFPTLINPPRFGNLPVSPVLESQDVHMPKPTPQVASVEMPQEPIVAAINPPDEKLIDALTSTKDRLPLLQLEEKVLAFLRNDRTDVLDLPPQNSFTRLLTHKLADYYNLAHTVTDDNASVRIYRSASRQLPMPLADIARTVPVGNNAHGPTSTAMKIMRREQLVGKHPSAATSTAPSSSVPSKTTSENGLEGPSDDGMTSPTESTPSRDKSKLTREEREAQYKLARDRIFADFQESNVSETISNGENSASMSRSSSSSGKRKSRRHKQPKDDSFEARSAYIASYAPIQPHANSLYTDPNINNGYPMSPSAYEQNMYGAAPHQVYSGFEAGSAYPNMHAYHPSMMQSFSPGEWSNIQAMQMQNPYFMSPPNVQFPHTSNMMMQGVQPMSGQMPEWYPSQANSYAPQGYMGSLHFSPQSPLQPRSPVQDSQFEPSFSRTPFAPSYPGTSYNHKPPKSLFNPQTRSFVPNNVEGRGSGRARFKQGGRNNTNSGSHDFSTRNNIVLTSREDSLKQKYGTPSSLPKKPPPQETRETRSLQDTNALQALPKEQAQLAEVSPLRLNGTEQAA